LETMGNDRKAAARLLGISRSTLYLKLKKYGLIWICPYCWTHRVRWKITDTDMK